MKKNGFLKSYVSSFLGALMILTTVANPLTGIVAQASVTPTTTQVVTQDASKTATFTHKHKTSGQYKENITINGTKYSGYTGQSACYYTKKEHVHTDECKEYKVRYTIKAVDNTNWHNWEDIVAWDLAYRFNYRNNGTSAKTYREILNNDPLYATCGLTDTEIESLMNSMCHWNYCSLSADWFTPNYFIREMWQKVANSGAPNSEYSGANDDWYWGSRHRTTVNGQEYIAYSTYNNEGTYATTLIYYDNKEQKFVGFKNGDAICRDEESPFSIPNLLYQPYYWSGKDGSPSSETYWTGNYICNNSDYIYVNDCGIKEGSTTATAKVSANSNNRLTYTVTKASGIPSTCTVKYQVKITNPSGTVVYNSTEKTLGSTAATENYFCTEVGTYKVNVRVSTTINGTTVDNDEANFTYTTVPKSTNVYIYNYDGTTQFNYITMTRGSENETLSVPSKTGYTFTSYDLSDGTHIYSGLNSSNRTPIVTKPFCPLNGGTVKLYAKCTPNSYKVTYNTVNPDLETNITETDTVVYDTENVALKKSATQYEGYIFDGWWSTDGNTQIFDKNGKYLLDGGTWKSTSNLTVNAKYFPSQYTLYYNNNKEDSVEANSEIVNYDEAYELPDKTATTYKGYTFLGWVDSVLGKIFNDDGSNTDNGTWKYTQDVRAKATYEANQYQVTYNTVNPDLESNNSYTETVTYDTAVILENEAKTYTGYTFHGWYEGETKLFNTNREYVKDAWDIDSDVTVTAKYTPNQYTLTYTLSKDGDPISKTVTYDTNYGLGDDKNHIVNYKGYTLLGFYDTDDNLIFNADGTNAVSGVWKWTKNITVTPKYEANQYTVTYYVENPAEETEVSHTDTFTFDAAAKLSTAKKTYAGWTFDGWYEGETKLFDVNGNYVNGTWDLDRNVVVTPKFTPISYTLSYDLERGGELTSKTILYNDSYGLSDTDKANRKSYKGYTFNGWFDANGNLIFNPDGSNTDTGIWRRTSNVTARTDYTANPYKVYYNTTESGSTSNVLDVVYDSEYTLPADKVNSVPKIDGYTFDGWFLSTDTSVKVFNTNGTSVKRLYDYDHDITVVVKYHKNKYKIHFNNTDIEDNNLDQTQEVTFDETYLDIAEAPYKVGYVFDGHTIEGTNTFIWDGKGNITHAIWDFVLGNDGTEINATKHYSPKVFTVDLGSDFDNDGVIDSIEDTKTATYDAAYFDLSIPDDINGYTFDGWYLYGDNLGRYIATYDPTTKTLTKDSDIWVYDDGINWVNENHKNLTLIKKWHKNTYTVKYQDTTVADTNKKSVTVTFDTAYDAIQSMPYKTGYVGQGYYFKDVNNTEQLLWNIDGTAVKDTFHFDLGADNSVIEVYKKYTPKTFTVEIGRDFDNDGVLDSVEDTKTATFDSTYFTVTKPDTIPGYTFDGFVLLENDTTVFDKDLNKANTKWIWDDGKDWNTETPTTYHLAMKWHSNTYKVHYNTTTVDDNNLDENQTVVYDSTYADIPVSPYKKGYVFDGHQVGTQYVWGKDGKATHPVWDFAVGTDNADVNALKHYTAKTFTVEVGRDFNNDGVLDSVEQTETITYDGTYGSLTFDVPEAINGYTFDGWYLIEQGKFIVSNEGTKESNTWVYDDGKDWNTEEYNNVFHIALKWHQNTYTVKYNDTTVEDTDKISRTFIFDEPYGAINTQPKKYGYTGIGWYFKDVNGVEQLIWNPDGTPAKSTFTFDLSTDNTVVDVYKKYEPNPHTVTVIIDNDPIPVVPPIDIPVIFDDPWKIPDGEPDKVPEKPGYTFDGWTRTPDPIPGVVPDPDIFVTPDGNPVDPEYHIDEDITLYPTYHKNSYTVRYNNTDTDDKDLNKKQEVVYDEPYQDIAPSPYKSGYIFEGHYLDKPGQLLPNDPNYQIWDKDGKVTKDKYTFIFDDKDKAVLDTHKIYTPKLITVKTGIDYNEDNKIDTTSLLPSGQTYNGEFTMYYDDIVPDGEFPILTEPGLTFTGWYLVGNSITGEIPLYTYDETTNTLVKTNNTWIWDDGKDWNKENGEAFTVVGRFSHDPVTVTIKTETDQKVNNEVGKKSDYKWNTKTRTEFYDLSYDNDNVPTKRGYTFTGYIVEPKNNGEEKNIWDKDAKSTKDTFRWLPTTGENDVKVISTFTANTIKGTIPTEKYDPTKDETTPNPTAIDETYDQPYKPLPSIPEKKGYDFDGITDKDGNPIWDEKGKPTQEVWEYIEEDIDKFIIKWKPKTYILVYPDKTEVTVTFDKAVNTNKTDSKSGHTFKGWTFKHNDKTIHAFGSDGKYNGSVWTYDFGKTGTKIPLSPVFDVNTYQITVKPMTEGYESYTMEVAYGSAYPDVAIPVKKGYVFNGYDLEYNAETGELSKTLWDKDGKAVESSFGYTHNITVLGQYKAKTYYLHLGDKKVIKVTYDELVERGITLDKEGTEDDNYTYTYAFTGWYMKNGTKLFNDEGFPVYTTWTLDLGEDGTHIYLDGQFDENKVEKEKPQPEEEEKEKKEEPSDKPEETSETVKVTPEVKPGKDHTQALKVLKKAAVIGGLTIGAILLIGLLIFLILLILFLLGEISLVYRFDYNKGKKKLDGICKIHKYKKDERQDEVKFYVTLKEKYYRPLLDTKSKLISVRLAPHWVDRHHGKAIRIQCKDIYHDYILRSSRNGKGDIDKGGFIELSLTESFNN